MNFLFPLLHAPGTQIHDNGTQPEYGRLTVRTIAPKHHAQARQQFTAAERLGQVIIRPASKASTFSSSLSQSVRIRIGT